MLLSTVIRFPASLSHTRCHNLTSTRPTIPYETALDTIAAIVANFVAAPENPLLHDAEKNAERLSAPIIAALELEGYVYAPSLGLLPPSLQCTPHACVHVWPAHHLEIYLQNALHLLAECILYTYIYVRSTFFPI